MSRAAVRVLLAGLCTVDVVQRVEELPAPGVKVRSTEVAVAAGGPAANAAVAVAALGGAATLLTVLGTHPLAGLARADLREHGVRLRDERPGKTEPPAISAVTVRERDGERTVVSHNAGGDAVAHWSPSAASIGEPATAANPAAPRSADRDAEARDPAARSADPAAADPGPAADLAADAEIAAACDEAAAAGAVLVDGHHGGLALAVARRARAAGVPVVLDAGSWKPVFDELLPLVDIAACSAQFRGPDLHERGVPTVITTAGAGPVRWSTPTGGGQVAVPVVPARDTLGAGDVWHGALTFALARGRLCADASVPELIRFANGVAAERVRHVGPRGWVRAVREQSMNGVR